MKKKMKNSKKNQRNHKGQKITSDILSDGRLPALGVEKYSTTIRIPRFITELQACINGKEVNLGMDRFIRSISDPNMRTYFKQVVEIKVCGWIENLCHVAGAILDRNGVSIEKLREMDRFLEYVASKMSDRAGELRKTSENPFQLKFNAYYQNYANILSSDSEAQKKSLKLLESLVKQINAMVASLDSEKEFLIQSWEFSKQFSSSRLTERTLSAYKMEREIEVLSRLFDTVLNVYLPEENNKSNTKTKKGIKKFIPFINVDRIH